MTGYAQQAADLIRRHGTVGFLLRAVGVPPANPWEGGGTELVAYPCRILIGSFRGFDMAGIQSGDSRILVSTDDLQITPDPADMLQLSHEDRDFQIVSVRTAMPSGDPLYYEVHAR